MRNLHRCILALAGPVLCAMLLAGCAQGNTPLDDAYALNGEYQAIAHAELGFLTSGYANDKAKAAVKAADNVAYGYVTDVSAQAKVWAQAPDDQKPREASLFDRIMTLGRNAVANLSGILNVVRGDPSVEGG